MSLLNILFMTRTKLIVLALIMVFSFPLYYNLGCISANCTAGAACLCGLSLGALYTVFIWGYITACVVGEVIKIIRKKNKNN